MEEIYPLIDSSSDEAPFPEEIQSAYEEIKVPDAYEMLLAYEKLSVEIKRQNKELRRVGEALGEIHDHCFQENESDSSFAEEAVDMQALLEERLRREYDDELKKKERVLLGMMDSIRNLLLNVEASKEKILSCLPRGRQIFFDPLPLQKELLATTQSFSSGVRIIYDKALTGLADYGIDMIEPLEGETFSVMEHRAIERVEGKNDGNIARVVSVGYRKAGDLIRSADVVVSTSSQL
ncbi:MAG: molecular chaperone GrpE (heat shock protein) [Chlamydiales bacterium]|jgi:hypothetical protein